jgi:hypothetical protein
MSDPTLWETYPSPGSDVMVGNRAGRQVETVVLARFTDPDTSQAAAASITPGRTERLVLHAFRVHAYDRDCGMNDDELVAYCPALHGPTAKSARSRLAKAGLLVDSGVRRKSNRGRDQIVWRLA